MGIAQGSWPRPRQGSVQPAVACAKCGAPGHKRLAARPMVRAAVRMTPTNVPRRRAGSAPPTDEEVGAAVSPPCRMRWVDRDCFWRSARRVTAVFRGSKLDGRRRGPTDAARAAAELPGAVYALRELSGSCRRIGGG